MLLVITPEIRIPSSELEFSYVRSSGPGGQNVNKVNSKAVLRWNLMSSPSLNLDLKGRMLARIGNQVAANGDLIITSDRFRDQIRNREDCIQKFGDILRAAAFIPKKRKKTKPSRSSRQKNKESKNLHSQKKNLRKTPGRFQ
jgi:ribosome-associated protein